MTIVLDDYRSLSGRFDRIYSLGMFEHVGVRNYRTYFSTARHLLESDGLFLLHTIGSNTVGEANDPWVERYIFPNSMLPSMAQITHAAEELWVIEDWHNFGPDYDRTLMAWYDNFERHWNEIAAAIMASASVVCGASGYSVPPPPSAHGVISSGRSCSRPRA